LWLLLKPRSGRRATTKNSLRQNGLPTMIPYEFGTWGIGFIFQVKGSIFPKALVWALPCSLCSYLFALYLEAHPTTKVFVAGPTVSCWASFTGMVGFLLGLRTQIAYSRFWEGGTLLQQVRGVWFNATSNLMAFSNSSTAKQEDVNKFKQLLVRLMSLLYCTALQQVASVDDAHFEILDQTGIEESSLIYLSCAKDRCEVVMQWIQRLIVENTANSVIPIAPPILSRVFQELSNGIVAVHEAKKIREFPFPFPYAQMITTFLIFIWAFTPFLAAVAVESPGFSAAMSFVITFAFWSMNYVAAELELPFGDDPNDLPVAMLQVNFNESLMTLLNPLVASPPRFKLQAGIELPFKTHKCRLTQMNDRMLKESDEIKDGLEESGDLPSSGAQGADDQKSDIMEDEINSIELVSSRNPDDVYGLEGQLESPDPPDQVNLDIPSEAPTNTKETAMRLYAASPAAGWLGQSDPHTATEGDLRSLGRAAHNQEKILFPEPLFMSQSDQSNAYAQQLRKPLESVAGDMPIPLSAHESLPHLQFGNEAMPSNTNTGSFGWNSFQSPHQDVNSKMNRQQFPL